MVTVIVVTAGVLDTWIKPSDGLLTGTPTEVVAVVSGSIGGVLWWRRSRPGLVAVVVMIGYLVAFTPIALAVAMYTVGEAYYRRARVLIAFGVASCAVGLFTLLAGDPAPQGLRDYGFRLALVVPPLVVGYEVATRRDLAAKAEERLSVLEREHDLLVQRARSEERAWIARDMHDVVAHRVGHMVLTAGSLIVTEAQGSPHAEAAERIASEGRQALGELREILGVLTPDRVRDCAPRAPQLDATQLPLLVERAAAIGQRVSLQVNGHPEMLPAPMQRAIYRIVQESLTNAAKHAPGAAVHVTVQCCMNGVRVVAANGPSTRTPVVELPSGGHGLIGLRERVGLLGGTVEAGPHSNGFQIRAWIPHNPDPTRTRPKRPRPQRQRRFE